MFDSHNHLQFPSFDEDRDDVMARAQRLGLECEEDSVTIAGVKLLLKPLSASSD